MAKKAVRWAKNEEWIEPGREIEKDASGNQQRFWAKVNESMRKKKGVTHTFMTRTVKHCQREKRL